jgi:hypothetical protein
LGQTRAARFYDFLIFLGPGFYRCNSGGLVGSDMRFFIPDTGSDVVRDAVYAWIRQNLAATMGAVFDDRKIWRVDWHQGMPHSAEVGERSSTNGEHVVAILYDPLKGRYHICTPTQGVVDEPSLIVPAEFVTIVHEFEADLPGGLI